MEPPGAHWPAQQGPCGCSSGGWTSPLPVPTVVSEVNVQADSSFLECGISYGHFQKPRSRSAASRRVSTADRGQRPAGARGRAHAGEGVSLGARLVSWWAFGGV